MEHQTAGTKILQTEIFSPSFINFLSLDVKKHNYAIWRIINFRSTSKLYIQKSNFPLNKYKTHCLQNFKHKIGYFLYFS